MADHDEQVDGAQPATDKDVGGAQGGADAGGAGNILAGVQPSNETDGESERRHD